MSIKLNQLIAKKRSNKEKLISVFTTAGYPDRSDTVEIILSLEKAKVDFIELGIPFSDPIADGPVIQMASDRALQNGMTLDGIFDIVNKVRDKSDIPILLMGYLNPIFHFGIEQALEKSREAAVNGWIIPDWPLEENQLYFDKFMQHDIDLIQFIAPNTPYKRIHQIDDATTSFIYCMAYTGVTGKDQRISPEMITFLKKIREILQHPLMIGFGIKSHQDFSTYSCYSDGVIIGSAFIQMLRNCPRNKIEDSIKNFIDNIRGI
jgi:tryptophan synthase alpha chain